jgi:hypothetical protein
MKLSSREVTPVVGPLHANQQAFPVSGTLASFSTAPSQSSRKDTTPEPHLRFHDTLPDGELIPRTFNAGF